MRLIIILSLLFANGCAYKPIVDSAGRSGTFDSNRADRITDDTALCDIQIKKQIGSVENIVFWLFDPESRTKYQVMMRNCMTKRGHSVLF